MTELAGAGHPATTANPPSPSSAGHPAVAAPTSATHPQTAVVPDHGYNLQGLAIDEDAAPVVHRLAAALREVDAPEHVVHATWKHYQHELAEAERVEHAIDEDDRASTEAAFRAEWGAAFSENVSLVRGLLKSLPSAVGDALLAARNEDGALLLNDPSIVRWITKLARGGDLEGTNMPTTAPDEIAQIRTSMADPKSAYHRGPDAARLQARYRDLLAAEKASPSPPPAVPTGAQGIETEIAAIKALMPNRNSEYNKGPKSAAMQERYRALLRAKQGAK